LADRGADKPGEGSLLATPGQQPLGLTAANPQQTGSLNQRRGSPADPPQNRNALDLTRTQGDGLSHALLLPEGDR